MENGWKPNSHMPPQNPGSMARDFDQLMEAWNKGPASVPGASWIIPPAQGKPSRTVGNDDPNKALFNRPKPNGR